MLFNRHINEIMQYFPHYAFYEKNNDDIRYYCTSCEDWRPASSVFLHDEFGEGADYVPAHNFKQNNSFICPFCNTELTAKSFRRGFKSLKHNRVFAICNNINGKLQIDVTKVYLSYLPSGEPHLGKSKLYTYQFERNKAKRYNASGRLLKTTASIPLDSWIGNIGYDNAVLVGKHEIAQTELKYSAYELLNNYNIRDFISYLIFYTKHNTIEYIVKAGLHQLAYEVAVGGWSRIINWKSNNLLKMLKLNSKNDLKTAGNSLNASKLQFYRKLVKAGEKKAMEIANIISESNYTTVESIHNKCNLSYTQILKYGTKISCTYQYWLDYLDNAFEVYDTPELMPKNIFNAHDRAVELRRIQTSKADNEKLAKRQQELEPYRYQWQDLLIVLPQSCEEIIAEGQVLKHCVGGYASRHANGITTIVFLRQVDKPDEPYYTIELQKDGTIRQCYGYKNNRAGNPKPDKIEAFEQAYTNYLQTEVLKIGNHYKAS